MQFLSNINSKHFNTTHNSMFLTCNIVLHCIWELPLSILSIPFHRNNLFWAFRKNPKLKNKAKISLYDLLISCYNFLLSPFKVLDSQEMKLYLIIRALIFYSTLKCRPLKGWSDGFFHLMENIIPEFMVLFPDRKVTNFVSNPADVFPHLCPQEFFKFKFLKFFCC